MNVGVVIGIEEVSYVIEVMGRPEAYQLADEFQESEPEKGNKREKVFPRSRRYCFRWSL